MKTEYYVILFRPKGCQCWTPVSNPYCGSPAGNFFACEIRATEQANLMAGGAPPVWLAGEGRWTAQEFKVARVVTDSPEPDFASPDPSPNRKPPQMT
jgi:hypothetical protein